MDCYNLFFIYFSFVHIYFFASITQSDCKYNISEILKMQYPFNIFLFA